MTILLIPAKNGQLIVISNLPQVGANINEISYYDHNSLSLDSFAIDRHIEAVQLLIHLGADINIEIVMV